MTTIDKGATMRVFSDSPFIRRPSFACRERSSHGSARAAVLYKAWADAASKHGLMVRKQPTAVSP
jgi:hypothetical protein